jgi:protoheme ferro-lyase
MGLYIALWQRLNSSETLKATGAGSMYIEAAGLSIEHIDVLCELDDEYAEIQKERRERGR